jgi:hypothetical protein
VYDLAFGGYLLRDDRYKGRHLDERSFVEIVNCRKVEAWDYLQGNRTRTKA